MNPFKDFQIKHELLHYLKNNIERLKNILRIKKKSNFLSQWTGIFKDFLKEHLNVN